MKKAAQQGCTIAFYHAGLMYMDGRGAAANNVQVYRRLLLDENSDNLNEAESNYEGRADYLEALNELESSMIKSQIK